MFDIPSSPLLVGRAVQLGRVQTFARQVAAGEGGALLLRGEAGAGKTRLARELAADARRDGTEVIVGACVAVGEEPLRLAALAEIVRSQAVPPAGGLATDAMLERVLTLVDELSAAAPLLLVVEDLHWADRGTCEILTVLCRHAHGRPAGIVMTCRDDELPRAAPRESVPHGAPARAVGGARLGTGAFGGRGFSAGRATARRRGRHRCRADLRTLRR